MSSPANERFPEDRKQDRVSSPHGTDGIFQSIDLFQGRREITISHQGECYRLRITKSGKLILNK